MFASAINNKYPNKIKTALFPIKEAPASQRAEGRGAGRVCGVALGDDVRAVGVWTAWWGGLCRGPLRALLGGGKSGREPETPARSPNTV